MDQITPENVWLFAWLESAKQDQISSLVLSTTRHFTFTHSSLLVYPSVVVLSGALQFLTSDWSFFVSVPNCCCSHSPFASPLSRLLLSISWRNTFVPCVHVFTVHLGILIRSYLKAACQLNNHPNKEETKVSAWAEFGSRTRSNQAWFVPFALLLSAWAWFSRVVDLPGNTNILASAKAWVSCHEFAPVLEDVGHVFSSRFKPSV